MIGSLRGRILERSPQGEVTLEVNSVGYRVFVPVRSVPELEIGEQAFLQIHTYVREEALSLYGFLTRDERGTFEALIAASGVGPKLALAILSVHSPNQLRSVVTEGDIASLTMVPGVGKRTAERLLVELKARLEVPEVDLVEQETSDARAGVREALASLGYGANEIRDVINMLPAEGPLEELLRQALKELGAVRA